MNKVKELSASRQNVDQGLSLWNLHERLHDLADALALAARRSDRLASQDADPDGQKESACSPREYFQHMLELRRIRDRYFGDTLFGEPAWEIMIELMIARIDGRELKLSDLTSSSRAIGVVTLQYVSVLEEAKLVESFDNTDNQNDPFLTLSSEAARRMAELYRARVRG